MVQKKFDYSLDLLQPLSNRLTRKEIKDWLKNTLGITVCLEAVRKLFKKFELKQKNLSFL